MSLASACSLKPACSTMDSPIGCCCGGAIQVISALLSQPWYLYEPRAFRLELQTSARTRDSLRSLHHVYPAGPP